LTQCENTERGWQFVDENGVLCEFVYPPERGIARIPVEGYVFSATKGRPVGVLLLELKPDQAA
jgi:hypothetical protein